jgi:Adenylate and Guanylate cyclase catalytic domain
MRFGLNSGPTTGGVLRGEKARFQLFGDVRDQHSWLRASYQARKLSYMFCLLGCQTVNTAARMESNGERNKIQVSQKTADMIKLSGKGFVSCHLPIHIGQRADSSLILFICFTSAYGWSLAKKRSIAKARE